MEQIGRYRVLRALAQGGMGQVYLAEDPTLERHVAIKLLHRDPTQNLEHEAKTLASLSHPNIVTIFEIGVDGGRDFIAMEYLPGKSLRELLESDPRPSREELLGILRSVTVALAAAHRSGVLHRDIKPENVVVTPSGVKVVDFGIARRLEERASNITPTELARVLTASMQAVASTATPGTQTMFGTPAYMAPELLHGEPSTPASDVYSLGITLHECLAGRRPYDATTLIELIAQRITAPPKRLDDPLASLVERMMAHDPAMRPTLREVSSALGEQPAVVVQKRRGVGLVIGGLGLLAAAGATVFAVTRGSSSEEPIAPPAAASLEATVAIAPVEQNMPTWGINQALPMKVARMLAEMLGKTTGAKLHGIPVDAPTLDAARAAKADYLVVIRVDEHPEKPVLAATVSVQNVKTARQPTELARVSRPSTELRQLLYDSLDLAIQSVSPAAKLARTSDEPLANRLVVEGFETMETGDFDAARTSFDGAVAADPELPDAWYGLAITLAWTDADIDLVLQATDRAVELSPPGPHKDLVRGLGMFLRERYAEARELLEPLDRGGKVSGRDQEELLYFLGEANWHDGRFDEAMRYFERGMAVAKKARGMAIHPGMYLVARREANRARIAFGLAGNADPSEIELSIRNYTPLIEGDNPGYRLWALMITGKPYTEAEIAAAYKPFDAAALQVARAAGEGDLAAAKTAFDQLWTEHVEGHRLTSAAFYTLESLGESLLAANLGEPATRLVKRLAEESKVRPRRGYHRLSTLTAALVKDPSLIIRTATTERNRQIAAAVDAELAGDRAHTATIYADVVAHPSYTWDYAERAALLRVYKELGRTKDIAALCKDTLQPAIFRQAFLVMRAQCRQAAGRQAASR